MALTSISLNTGATIACGSAWARNGSVTLDTNTISICSVAGQGLAAGLAQTSGAVSRGVAPMALQSMDAFLDTVMRSGRHPRPQVAPPRDRDIPPGMVPDRTNEYSQKYGPPEPTTGGQALAYATPAAVQPNQWDVWVAGYGSRYVIDGDVDAGWHESTSTNSGIAAGLNFAPNSSSDVGVALSWNTADFALAAGNGSGTSDTVYLALRGRTSFQRGYVEGALAYGLSDITTDRTVTIAGTDRLTGETTANSLATHVEAGYNMGIFTPFVGLRGKSVTTDAYSESAALGSSSYALHYDEVTDTSLRTELGVAVQWPADPTVAGAPTFGLRAAWAHELATNEPGSRSFLTTPGVAIPMTQATRDRDSLILAANLGIAAANGFYVDGAVNAEYSSDARGYGGSLTVGYTW